MAGAEIDHEIGSGGRIQAGEQINSDQAIYLIGDQEWRRVSVRSGLRYTMNDAFGSAVLPSVSLRIPISRDLQARTGYARGFRTPSLKERYFEFIDGIHTIVGNPDLEPEYGDHWSASLTRVADSSWFGQTTVSGYFTNLSNQIDYGQSPDDPTVTTYINIASFSATGGTIEQTFRWGQVWAYLSHALHGRSPDLTNGATSRIVFNHETTFKTTFRFPKWKLRLNASIKAYGRSSAYIAELGENGELITSISSIEPYQMFGLNANKEVIKNLHTTVGVRNLMNVTYLDRTGAGSTHGSAKVPISFGRSFFLTISYNLPLSKNKQK
jgi:outer membrane receptor for ferrienterochelin and colicins